MRRRRRPHREIAFSFDSFLDVVANVVGIILRLTLVSWVGARSYKALVPAHPLPPPPALTTPAALPEPTDPRTEALAAASQEADHWRREASDAEQRLLTARRDEMALGNELRALGEARQTLARQCEAISATVERGARAEQAALSARELARRAEKVLREVEAARGAPGKRERVRYPAPISQEAQEDEVMFELSHGRVTLLDHGALVKLIREGLNGKADQLRQSWSLTDETPAVGAFRARYTVERARGALEAGASSPVEGAFRYGATAWEAVPVSDERGEPVDEALKAGSAFRRLADALDPGQSVVTLWVYPDSFAAYRRLRDHLHGRGMVVAGRPLPEGAPIGASRHGTASRGQ